MYCLLFKHGDGVLINVQGLFLWSATNSQCTLLVSYLALYIFEHSQGFCWGCDFTKSVVSSICESKNKQWPLCQLGKKAQSPWSSSGFYSLLSTFNSKMCQYKHLNFLIQPHQILQYTFLLAPISRVKQNNSLQKKIPL